VRRSRRYDVLSVVDSTCAGLDAGEILDGRPAGIPVAPSLDAAIAAAAAAARPATHFVVGLATDGGTLPPEARAAVRRALEAGLNVVSGLHDFVGDDPDLAGLAAARGATIRDVRRTPPRGELHAFTGVIEQVTALKVAVLGTDSAVGKRTTAWKLVEAFEAAGVGAQLIGTGQTAWMQGARYSIILDSLINDFVAGEIEHAVWLAWKETGARAIVLEGQGSLMNPAYPGGFELLAAGRPEAVLLQHAPARAEYDGFPGYPLHPLERQIRAIEMISDRPVVAITLNHEGLAAADIPEVCERLQRETGLPVVDPLVQGLDDLVPLLLQRAPRTHAPAIA
jgi:uncharacterized NAD-dependent epimerase/dehydratase family protein